jgi:hypothetical protein
MKVDMAVESLIARLARPTYNYRMAKPMLTSKVHSKSAETRLKNAENEIKEAVQQYLLERFQGSDTSASEED